MKTQFGSRLTDTLRLGAVGGMAGGLAEVVWIALYGAVTGTPVGPVARGIIGTFVPSLATAAWSSALGVGVHLGLAVALGVVLTLGLRFVASRVSGRVSEFGIVVPALAAVWAINFLLVLPVANPGYVHLLPFAVTLISKLLFGLSAASVIRASGSARLRIR